MTREDTMFAKRLIDLSRQAQQRGYPTYTDFLNLNEQTILHSIVSDLYTSFETWGGYSSAERQMIEFRPDAFVREGTYPMICCGIAPLNQRFADALTHRDVLGSLMNLGIQRGKIGDILVKPDQIYVFLQEKIGDYVMDELTRIKHTSVSVSIQEADTMEFEPQLEACSKTISSNRLDCIVAAMCGLPRSQSSALIQQGKVFINGREILSSSRTCQGQEIISVRGIGRFRFEEVSGTTKKGRMKIQYSKFV